MLNKESQTIFGEEFSHLVPALDVITKALSSSSYTYQFMSSEEFKRLPSLDQAMKVYWTEMLSRLHLAAATSILRSQRWVQGTMYSYEKNNFPVFGASLRGLIESAADTNDALMQVPVNLAEMFNDVNSAVRGEMIDRAFVCEELENLLIHYSHGRKLAKNSGFPKSHKAKTSRDYLEKIQVSGDAELTNCYAELCEVTHPASLSVLTFLQGDTETEDVTLTENQDDIMIMMICLKYRNAISKIFCLAFNTSIIVLKLLNLFRVEELYTEIVDSLGTNDIPVWRKVESILQNSSAAR